MHKTEGGREKKDFARFWNLNGLINLEPETKTNHKTKEMWISSFLETKELALGRVAKVLVKKMEEMKTQKKQNKTKENKIPPTNPPKSHKPDISIVKMTKNSANGASMQQGLEKKSGWVRIR